MTLLRKTCAFALTTTTAALISLTSALPTSAQSIVPVQQNHKTYLVNGLASVMPFVGYGFSNLKDKLGEAKHYSYATPVEGRIAVQPLVLSEIKKEYAKDPSVQINLVGISYGANIVTSLPAQLQETQSALLLHQQN